MLTVIAAAVGVALFFYSAFTANVGIAYAASIVGAIGGLVLALITTFKPTTAPTLAIPYALFEGLFRWYFVYFPVEIPRCSTSGFISNLCHHFGDVWFI